MKWLIGLAGIMFAISIYLLAVGGAERPHRIQTFGGSSPEEDAFERRATQLRTIGFVGIGLAVVVGLIVVLKLFG